MNIILLKIVQTIIIIIIIIIMFESIELISTNRLIFFKRLHKIMLVKLNV